MASHHASTVNIIDIIRPMVSHYPCFNRSQSH